MVRSVSCDAPITCEEVPVRFADSWCGHIVSLALICYGFFNVLLFIKFTPVYVATECGDQQARLEHISWEGDQFLVGLEIQVTCWNPNNYQVQVKTSTPGMVWLGADRGITVGNLTLMEGSTLPMKGTGDIKVQMDASLSMGTSMHLAPHMLTDDVIPMFLELQFDVGVSLNFGLSSFGCTAPFKKKCGMNMAGLLVQTDKRLGPMICRDSFAQIDGNLPQVDEAHIGAMAFSAAQMAPGRVAMGETAKNVSILGTIAVVWFFGFSLLYRWIQNCFNTCGSGPRQTYTQVQLPVGSRLQPSCFRAESGNVVELQGKVANDGSAYGRTMGFLLGFTPYGQSPAADMEMAGARPLRMWDRSGQLPADTQSASGHCLSGPLMNFLSCGAFGNKRRPRPDLVVTNAPQPMYVMYQPSCARGTSGNVGQ